MRLHCRLVPRNPGTIIVSSSVHEGLLNLIPPRSQVFGKISLVISLLASLGKSVKSRVSCFRREWFYAHYFATLVVLPFRQF